MKSRNLEQIFSPADLERIGSAVGAAEQATSGEIVPYAILESDGYREAIWRGALIMMAVALVVLGVLPLIGDVWMPIGISGVAAIALAAGILGGVLALFIPSLRRRLAGREMIRQRVAARAAQAFLAEEIFNTRDRTGILIFLSLMEHRVIVLGDSGINAKMKQEEWDDITRSIVDGIRSGKPAEGLINAIERCGSLLVERGFGISRDDKDELSNRLRMRDS